MGINSGPKIVIQVIYKSKRGYWRGFCTPYDVTCESSSKKECERALHDMVGLYEQGLKKYHYPENLLIKPLSDSEDKMLFERVLPIVSRDVQQKLSTKYLRFQQQKNKERFSIRQQSTSGYYYSPVFS